MMSGPTEPPSQSEAASRDEELSFLFAQMVMQQANMAMMLLGKMAHPESGQVIQDLEAARLFIDQLEMLQAKTKGNLSKEEEGLLKQSLMNLRLMYVEAVEFGASSQARPEPKPAAATPEPPEKKASQAAATDSAAAAEAEEHRKKFTKKY